MNEKRKVLLLVNSLSTGGAEKHVVSLINGLDRTHLQLSLGYLKPAEHLLDQIDREKLDHLFCCNVGSGLDWLAIKQIMNHIRRYGIDIVLCTNQYALLYGYLAARISRRNCRVVEVFHTTELPGNANRIHQLMYRYLFAKCDEVVFVSQNQQNYWIEEGLKLRKHRFIHNGVDSETFRDNLTQDEKRDIRARFGFEQDDYVVGICAAMRPEKNHLGFLESINNLRNRGVLIKALLIGDGPLRAEINDYIENQSLQDVVKITGFQSDVKPLIAICDCMAMNSTAVETFSIAVLESMALGKPIVSASIGGIPEQVVHGETGFLFEKGDVQALADYLAKLSDRGLQARMGQAARERILERFSIDRMLFAYESMLMDHVAENRRMQHLCTE